MTKRVPIRERLGRLENEHRFLTWVLSEQFLQSLTDSEVETLRRDSKLPDPLPSRPSMAEGLDRQSLLKLWEEQERVFSDRCGHDFDYFSARGHWPEQMGRVHYSHKNGMVLAKLQTPEVTSAAETTRKGVIK